MLFNNGVQGTARNWNSDSPDDWLLNFDHGRSPGKPLRIALGSVQ